MKPKQLKVSIMIGAANLVAGCAGMSDKKIMMADKMPFSGPESVADAGGLWKAMAAANMVRPNRLDTKPYTGAHSHGAVLQNFNGMLTVDGQTGPVIIKSNFSGEGVSVSSVTADPEKYLKAVTVMYQRDGYDPENNNWFWAKYLPDGTLDKSPKGIQLAGRVAKGAPVGCIACHTAAPGGDLVFTHDRFK